MGNKKKNISMSEAESNKNAKNLDALLMDLDENKNDKNTEDDTTSFNEFMAEYRDMISKIPGNTKNVVEKEVDPQEEYLKPRATAKKQVKNEKPVAKREDWSEDITLAPEEYEDLDDGSGMHEEIPADDPIPDFNLGEATEESDDKFQLSINFEGEHKSAVNEEIPEEKKYDPDNPRLVDWVFDIAEMFVFVLATVLILTSFLFKHAEVSGNSMLNTYEHGDHLIISNVFYTPQRGDVIVFEDYSKEEVLNSKHYSKPVIKRIIAIEGDTVELSLSEDKKSLIIKVNGETIKDEHACYKYPENGSLKINESLVVVVEEGQVFVMGDNRYHSTDSREVGTINVDAILGRVLFRFYPFDKFGTVE